MQLLGLLYVVIQKTRYYNYKLLRSFNFHGKTPAIVVKHFGLSECVSLEIATNIANSTTAVQVQSGIVEYKTYIWKSLINLVCISDY